MKISGGTIGCVFVLRLEHGEAIVTGPIDGAAMPTKAVLTALAGAQEVAAVGTLFPDAAGAPRLHMHGPLAVARRRGWAASVRATTPRASTSGPSADSWL